MKYSRFEIGAGCVISCVITVSGGYVEGRFTRPVGGTYPLQCTKRLDCRTHICATIIFRPGNGGAPPHVIRPTAFVAVLLQTNVFVVFSCLGSALLHILAVMFGSDWLYFAHDLWRTRHDCFRATSPVYQHLPNHRLAAGVERWLFMRASMHSVYLIPFSKTTSRSVSRCFLFLRAVSAIGRIGVDSSLNVW